MAKPGSLPSIMLCGRSIGHAGNCISGTWVQSLPEGRSEKWKWEFSLGIMFIFSYTSPLAFSFSFLFSTIFITEGWSYCLISLTILSAVSVISRHPDSSPLRILSMGAYSTYVMVLLQHRHIPDYTIKASGKWNWYTELILQANSQEYIPALQMEKKYLLLDNIVRE